MHRTILYLLLFAATALLQVFLFDNLSVSIYLNPLVYLAFIVLLPLDTLPVAVLLSGLAMGLTMDFSMGAAGVNTLSVLPVAFLRPWILRLYSNRDDFRDGGVPSPERLGARTYWYYLITMVALHSFIFFSLEALSWTHILHTLLRIVVSGAVSVFFIWLIGRIFTANYSVRL